MLALVNECIMRFVIVRVAAFVKSTRHKGFIVVVSKIIADIIN